MGVQRSKQMWIAETILPLRATAGHPTGLMGMIPLLSVWMSLVCCSLRKHDDLLRSRLDQLIK